MSQHKDQITVCLSEQFEEPQHAGSWTFPGENGGEGTTRLFPRRTVGTLPPPQAPCTAQRSMRGNVGCMTCLFLNNRISEPIVLFFAYCFSLLVTNVAYSQAIQIPQSSRKVKLKWKLDLPQKILKFMLLNLHRQCILWTKYVQIQILKWCQYVIINKSRLYFMNSMHLYHRIFIKSIYRGYWIFFLRFKAREDSCKPFLLLAPNVSYLEKL